MVLDTDQKKESETGDGGGGGGTERASTGNGNGVVVAPHSSHRLRLNPSSDHKPDCYEDLQLDFSPLLFSSLERHLPPSVLSEGRDVKVQYMREILLRYSPEGERTRVRTTRSLSHSLSFTLL